MQIINPPTLAKPVGYANAIETRNGRTIYLAGQIAMDAQGNVLHAGDLAKQFDKALSNLEQVLAHAGARMTDIVKLLIFVRSKSDYKARLKEIGKVYQAYFGKYYPAMSLVEVSSLFEDDALIEIEGVAVVED